MATTDSRRVPLARVGGAARQSFARSADVVPMPNLNQVQRDSFNWFLKEGLKEVFAEMSPIDSPSRDSEV